MVRLVLGFVGWARMHCMMALHGMMTCVIASVGKARRQGGSNITFVQNSAFLVLSIDTLSGVSIPKFNTGIWVSVPVREGIGTPGIDTCLQGYRYPLDTPLGIGTKGGYRYPSPLWDLSIDTGIRVPIPAVWKQFLELLEA
ncbi:hypothetical protein GQ457_02G032400 [Hibiscus cannabinus]